MTKFERDIYTRSHQYNGPTFEICAPWSESGHDIYLTTHSMLDLYLYKSKRKCARVSGIEAGYDGSRLRFFLFLHGSTSKMPALSMTLA